MTDQSPGQYNWGAVLSGDTVWQRKLTFDFDLTGYQARLHFRTSLAEPVVVALSTGDGIDVLEGGELQIGSFTAPDVTQTTRYIYDLELTSPEGTVRTYLSGALTVKPDVTRSEA